MGHIRQHIYRITAIRQTTFERNPKVGNLSVSLSLVCSSSQGDTALWLALNLSGTTGTRSSERALFAPKQCVIPNVSTPCIPHSCILSIQSAAQELGHEEAGLTWDWVTWKKWSKFLNVFAQSIYILLTRFCGSSQHYVSISPVMVWLRTENIIGTGAVRTSWQRDAFCIAGPLWGEYTGYRCISTIKRSVIESISGVFFGLSWTNNQVAGELRRHAAHVTPQ